MKKLIIGVAGKMGSGKDTVGSFLVKNNGFTRLAFADNLKQIAMEVFEMSEYDCYDDDGKFIEFKKPKTITTAHLLKIKDYAVMRNGFPVDFVTFKNISSVSEGVKLKSPREVLQFLGTEILRNCIDADYHAKVVKRIIDERGLDKVVITDCRFPNEMKAISDWGGYTVLVERESLLLDGGISGHASENSLNEKCDYDFIIGNDGTLKALEINTSSVYSSVVHRINNQVASY